MVILIVLLDDTFTCRYLLTHSGGTHEHSRATTSLDNYQLTDKQLKSEYIKQPAVTSVVRFCTCNLGASLLSISLVYSHSHA